MKPIKGTAPSVTMRVARSRGRPKAAEPGGSVSTWLPASAHDKLIAVAQQQERSVSEVVRQVIVLNILNVNVFPKN